MRFKTMRDYMDICVKNDWVSTFDDLNEYDRLIKDFEAFMDERRVKNRIPDI